MDIQVNQVHPSLTIRKGRTGDIRDMDKLSRQVLEDTLIWDGLRAYSMLG